MKPESESVIYKKTLSVAASSMKGGTAATCLITMITTRNRNMKKNEINEKISRRFPPLMISMETVWQIS